jgi:hypothetical protein
MKKQLGKQIGMLAACGVMVVASQMAFAQYGPPGPPPPSRQGPPPGRGWSHEGWYHRGGYVPRQYRGRHYVVSDWRTYRLPPPRPGYHYIRSDNGDFLLAAIATGAIISIVANSR